MIEGAWAYIWAAYALSLGALAVLVLVAAQRSAHWRKRARALAKDKAP